MIRFKDPKLVRYYYFDLLIGLQKEELFCY